VRLRAGPAFLKEFRLSEMAASLEHRDRKMKTVPAAWLLAPGSGTRPRSLRGEDATD